MVLGFPGFNVVGPGIFFGFVVVGPGFFFELNTPASSNITITIPTRCLGCNWKSNS